MYSKLHNLCLAFHGCSKEVANKVIVEGDSLNASTNKYDWLGNGIYFWENNYKRAEQWAKSKHKDNYAVIGVVIDLGYCLNLTDSSCTDILKEGYELLRLRCASMNIELPQNNKTKGTSDILLRNLDCAVIEQIHDYNKQNNLQEYDSVRGVFTEGVAPYPGSAFYEKTHIQICIRNPNCIKGYFRPALKDTGFPIP